MSKLPDIAAVKRAMLTKINDSLLDEKDAVKLKFKPLTAEQTKQLNVPAEYAGFLIPYFDISGKPTKFWRLRYLEDTRKGFDVLSGRKALRYVQAAGGINEVYLPPFVDWREIADNVEIPLVITEGELKAACATKLRIPTIGLGGVYCFKSSKNKEVMLPALRQFKWKERSVMICYDSDAVTNPMVVMAENQLADLLTQEGAVVQVARLTPGGSSEKVGLDDYLLKHDPEELLALLSSSELYGPNKALHAMNELVAYVRNPGLVYDYSKNMSYSCQNFTAHAYSNYWFTEFKVSDTGTKQVKKQTAVEWLRWACRNELEALTFEPGQERVVNGKLNLWEGWKVEPKKGDIKPWRDLLDHVFGEADHDARKWFEQWCAYPLQHPGYKMASAAVIWGRIQGSGKTLIGRILMSVYGKYATEIKDSDLENLRNEWAENMQFVLADDITSNDNRKLKRRLMTLITQHTIRLDKKFVPSYTLRDVMNMLFTSNDPDAFYMDDDDRRYFIWEVVNGRLDVETRKRIVAWYKSKEGVQAMFWHLLNVDLKGFDPDAEPVVTTAKKEMIHITKSDLGSWVADLHNGGASKLKLQGDLFTASELLTLYDPGQVGRVTANGMARELKRSGFNPPGKNGSMAVTKFGNVRLYAIRNLDKWKFASMKEIISHYEGSRSMVAAKPKF
jgi:hypothetical protein